jgi:alkaline phosphatase D
VRRIVGLAAATTLLLACPSPPPVRADVAPRALSAALPPVDQVLTRIAVGSCTQQDATIPILAAVAASRPDLFLDMGDNVYGDDDSGDPALPVLAAAYETLEKNRDFAALRAEVPILAVWDDHDYARNDGGAEWAGKGRAEELFEAFWGASSLGGGHDGVYGAAVFGPEGRRVQVVLLDTRSFRSALRPTDQRDAPGRERYLPDPDPDKTMLGAEQWRWLAAELAKPAEIRLIVSSIQVLADAHGYEAWRTLASEQARLVEALGATPGVVLLSGDRHVAAIYEQGSPGRIVPELTASSLNKSFGATYDEQSSNQVGPAYAPVNFGVVDIDWTNRTLSLSVRGRDGSTQRSRTLSFEQLGMP